MQLVKRFPFNDGNCIHFNLTVSALFIAAIVLLNPVWGSAENTPPPHQFLIPKVVS